MIVYLNEDDAPNNDKIAPKNSYDYSIKYLNKKESIPSKGNISRNSIRSPRQIEVANPDATDRIASKNSNKVISKNLQRPQSFQTVQSKPREPSFNVDSNPFTVTETGEIIYNDPQNKSYDKTENKNKLLKNTPKPSFQTNKQTVRSVSSIDNDSNPFTVTETGEIIYNDPQNKSYDKTENKNKLFKNTPIPSFQNKQTVRNVSSINNGSNPFTVTENGEIIYNELQNSFNTISSIKKQNKNKALETRRLAGFWSQFQILLWKNFLLTKSNICGLITEIIAPLALISLLILIRYFLDAYTYNNQTNSLNNVFDLYQVSNTSNLVLYYPNNTFISNIVNTALNTISSRKPTFNPLIQASPVSNGTQLDNITQSNLLALISFPSTYTTSFPNNVQYTIYTKETNDYQYHSDLNFVNKIDYMFSNSPEYYCFKTTFFQLYNYFNAYKLSIDMAIISSLASITLNDAEMVNIQQFNCPKYIDDSLKTTFSFFIPIIISIAFLFTIIVTVGNIVFEKQSKVKEYLKLVGVKWHIIWLTWFLRSMIIYIVLSIVISSIGLIPFTKPNDDKYTYATRQLFLKTNFGITFLVFFIYSFQTSVFTIFIAKLFSKPFNAKVVVILIWIISSINFYDYLPYSALKYIFCIFPNTGLIFALQCVFQYERSLISLGYLELYTNIFNDTLVLGYILLTMFGSSFLYLPIAWYIDKVSPGEFGIAQPLCFLFKCSYWSSNENKVRSLFPAYDPPDMVGFEKDPEDLNASVSLLHINKVFESGSNAKIAVNDLSLNIYENQVTGLLGQNGAGKTTITFMLTGLIPPTDGTAFILGHDISTEIDEIRSSIGYCPQHDILYDDLTVEEHLELIGLIKSYSKYELKNEIINLSDSVGLYKDLKTKTKALSGGMKRRLSFAMSIIGGSKVIILDEPTSGLDPFNRRLLWDLIKKYKENRTIILTTHFMEEADALCDRIAIMNHGEIRCCGSPMYLKNFYGSGYRLTASKADNFNQKEFFNLVLSILSYYKVETNIAKEISIGLLTTASDKLPKLLELIEEKKDILGITGYGVSSPTIEEVFLKIDSLDEGDDDYLDEELKHNTEILADVFQEDIKQNTGCVLWMQQLRALFIKRTIIFFRRYILAIIILLFPLIVEAIVCAVIPTGTNLSNSITGRVTTTGTYDLNILNYKPYNMPYTINGATTQANLLKNLFQTLYTDNYRSGITLDQLSNDSISSYVFQKRTDDIKNIVSNYYTGMSFNFLNSTKLSINAYYSTLAYHSSASILNEISNILLAYYSSNSLTKTINTYNNPIGSSIVGSGDSFLDFLSCIDILPLTILTFVNSVLVGFCISLLVLHVGRERVNGSKSLQLLSGTHFFVYWISNHIFDLLICLFQSGCIISMLKMVDVIRNDSYVEINAFTDDMSLGFLLLIIWTNTFSWTTYAYIWSFLFKTEIVGFVVLTFLLGMFSFLDMVWSFLELFLRLNSISDIVIKFIISIRWLFTILVPNVSIKRVMFNIKIRQNIFCINSLNNILQTSYRTDEPIYSFKEPGISLFFLVCLAQFLIGNWILFVIEKKPKFRFNHERRNVVANARNLRLENDVANEFKRIQSQNPSELADYEPLVVDDLLIEFKKKRKNFIAVNHLTFGVKPKECFGLLGLNGAGKTSTFRILTGELHATNGNAYINGYDINEDKSNARKYLGFCPQFDALPEFLTVTQTLTLFARLRGLDSEIIPHIVADMITIFKLFEFKNKLVQNLSGGNKRKLSTAIAFIGRPKVVILDEPTTGVDPASKRYLWTVINKARDLGVTIVLTSHSMEECEALCTNIGIMVNGQFQCLGNIQHLKSKYGEGYTLTVKLLKSPRIDEMMNKLFDFLSKKVKGIRLLEQQQETIKYHVEPNYNKLNKPDIANIFDLIEKNKHDLGIETYSVCQTTLEEIFLSFARQQRNDLDFTQKSYFKRVFIEHGSLNDD